MAAHAFVPIKKRRPMVSLACQRFLTGRFVSVGDIPSAAVLGFFSPAVADLPDASAVFPDMLPDRNGTCQAPFRPDAFRFDLIIAHNLLLYSRCVAANAII